MRATEEGASRDLFRSILFCSVLGRSSSGVEIAETGEEVGAMDRSKGGSHRRQSVAHDMTLNQ